MDTMCLACVIEKKKNLGFRHWINKYTCKDFFHFERPKTFLESFEFTKSFPAAGSRMRFSAFWEAPSSKQGCKSLVAFGITHFRFI